MMATWVKLLFSKIKNVKKRVWVTLSLVMGSTVIWYSLGDWNRYSILAKLGNEEANIRLGDSILYTNLGLTDEFKVEGPSCALLYADKYKKKDLYTALDYYFKAIKNKKAQSKVLSLANGLYCDSVSRNVRKYWEDIVANYISSRLKDNITEIENWITNQYDLWTVIRFYYRKTKSPWNSEGYDHTLYGKRLIEKSINSNFDEPLRLINLAFEVKYDDFMNLSQRILANGAFSDMTRQRVLLYQAIWLGRYGNEDEKNESTRLLSQLVEEGYEDAKYVLVRWSNTKMVEDWWSKAGKIVPNRLDFGSGIRYWNFIDLYSHNDFQKSENKEPLVSNSYLIYLGENLGTRLAEDPDDYWYKLTMVQLYMEEKIYDKAKNIYEELFKWNATEGWEKKPRILTDGGQYAALKLGDIYYQGLGVKQDLEQARKYYGMVCDYKAEYESDREKQQKGCDGFREVNEKLR